MDRTETVKTTLVLPGFIFCTFFMLITALLYTWGTPSWFSNFPYTVGFRFLLALGVYLLSCVVYFIVRMAFLLMDAEFCFLKVFCISFIPVMIFSILIILNISLQVLHAFYCIVDMCVWFFAAVVLFYLHRNKRTARRFRKPVRRWLLFSVLYFVSGILSLLPFFQTSVLIIFRLFVLTIFSFITLAFISSREPTGLKDVVVKYRLSPREAEVLALLLEGRTNNEIGEELFVSLSTIKAHITSIFQKTNARNRLEVAALCKK